jgi:phage gp16-like protein
MASSIAAIHVAKKQLGLDDDTYRAKLTKITGKASTKAMSEDERQKVLTVFRNEGFQPAAQSRRPDGRAKLSGKYAGKLQALWIAGWNLGVFRERDDAALVAFVKRQTGLDAVQFLHHADDAKKAIEALKAILKRDARVMYGNLNGQDWLQSDAAKVAWAQWRILRPSADLINRQGFDAEVYRLAGVSAVYLSDISGRQWQTVMNQFGEQIRERKAVK